MFMFFNFYLLILSLFFNECVSWCWWTKCCLDHNSFIQGLEANLSASLFGQHLVHEPILTALSSHFKFSPQKALVLTFHGPPGVGKTYTAKMIAHHIFDGDKRYVKFFSGRNDFAEAKDIAVHKENLACEIRSLVSSCGHSVFIFDEADKMADGIFDVLRPFVDFLDHYHEVDYRRAVFIFISNIGTSEISNIYYNRKGRREDLKLSDFEDVLSKWLYNKPGGFKSTSLVTNFLIDNYIPFLPLEEEHIKKCIAMALRENGVKAISDHTLSLIYDLQPRKKEGAIEYIPSNCKKITSEVKKYLVSRERDLIKRRIKDEGRIKDEM